MQGLGWGQLCLMVSLGAGHIWAAKTTLSRDNSLGLSLRHPCCTHWVPLLVLSPRRDLTLPIWSRPLYCCQGTPSGTRSGTTPHWLSQLVTVRGGGDDIPAPAKTNTAPSKHAGLGKPVPRPSITEPSALQPTTAWPGNGAGKKQRGLLRGVLSNKPPSRCCWLKDEAPSFIPRLGPGGSPWAPDAYLLLPRGAGCCHGVLGTARGSVPDAWHAEDARGGESSSLGWLCRRVPCSCWLGPRRKVGQSHLQGS